MRRFVLLLTLASAFLAGCEELGIESASSIAARREADGKAVGGACRHAGRAIEDCYGLYKKADRAAVFAGWREMNDYMRENNIEIVPPKPPAPPTDMAEHEDEAPPEKSAGQGKKAS